MSTQFGFVLVRSSIAIISFHQHTGFVRTIFCCCQSPVFPSSGTVALFLTVRSLPTTMCPQSDHTYRLAYISGIVKRKVQEACGLSRILSPWLARDRARKRGCDEMSFPGSVVTGELHSAGASERRFFRPRSHVRFGDLPSTVRPDIVRVADDTPAIQKTA